MIHSRIQGILGRKTKWLAQARRDTKGSGAARRGGGAGASFSGRLRTSPVLPRFRGQIVLSALAYGIATLVPGLAQAQATTPSNPPAAPIQILVFPQRDFVSASGYAEGDLVVVKVIHPNGVTVSTDPNNLWPAQPDPRAAAGAPFAGIVEVNHPGGACWFQTTPDIRPGDVVEIDVVSGPSTGRKDATTVRNVTAKRPVQSAADTVQIHGTAVQADGVTPIPVGELEQRLVANRDAFLKNGRRTLRATAAAGSDGTLAYDAPGSINWTATYAGLQPADVTRALGAESRILWLPPVVAPAVATEGTIYENGAGVAAGPAAPCSAPLEFIPPPPGSDTQPPTTPGGLTAQQNVNTITLSWSPSTDNVGVVDYGVYRDGLPIANVQSADGVTAPAPTYTDRNVPPGTYIYTVDAGDAVGNRSAPSSGFTVTILNQPPATVPPGTVVNEPPVAPIQIIGFPSRDFISSSGFQATDTVDVQIIRNSPNGLVVVSTSTWTPQPDPRAAPTDPFAGIVEVNHPGGGCWDGVTPELRAGDIIREIAYNPDGSIRTVNQTTVSNVTANRAVKVQPASSATSRDGIVTITGTAMGPDGKPLPLDQIEQRLVANRDAFDLNGRRTVRAGGAGKDGVLTYDTANNPTGVNWTATYSGLSSDDVYRAVGGTSLTGRKFTGSESRILWLGSQPLAGLELTIFENSDQVIPGPSAGVCTGTFEAPDTKAPSTPTLDAKQSGANGVQLSWTTSTDDWYVNGYRIFQDGSPVVNVGSSTLGYLLTAVAPGPHTYTVAAFDSASPLGAGTTPIDQVFNGFGKPYGNLSTQSNAVPLTQADVTAPSVPLNVGATFANGTVTLTWAASKDDVGVAGYGVYRDGVKVGLDVGGPPFTESGTAAGSGSHTYTVDAVDAAGNRSAKSGGATVIVTSVAPAAPTAPTSVSAAYKTDIHGRDVQITWTAANDPSVTGFGVYRIDFKNVAVKIADQNVTDGSYTDSNFPAGTYTYGVDAVNSAGTRSAKTMSGAVVIANDPPVAPHSLIAFPARDFISTTGYTPNRTYQFSLIRGGVTYFSETKASDPTTGVIEVNHPGGSCWTGTTPDMRAGDVIRITDTTTGVADQTTVASVTAQRPIATNANTIIVHGTSMLGPDGIPLPVAQVESRLVANRDLFEFNGRRVLRAGGAGTDGTLVYDPVSPTNPQGVNWTATYTGLSATDMVRAVGGITTTGTTFVGAESRALWLGRDPLALTESSIFENGPGVVGGPSAPCTAAAETPVAAAAVAPAASADFTKTASQTFTLTNTGGKSMNIAAFYVAGLNPGNFSIINSTCVSALAANASCTVTVTYSGTTAFTQANLSFADDAANTTDQSVSLTAGTAPAPSASTLLAFNANPIQFGTVNRGTTKDQTITLRNAGTANTTLGLIKVDPGSYAVQPSTTCNTGTTLAPGKTCSIVVRFTAPSVVPNPNPAVTGVLEVDAANIPQQKITTNLTATVK